jgi:MFS family permease
MVQTVLVLFAIRDLHLTAGTLGLVLAIGGAGALVGAVATSAVARRLGLGRAVVAAAVMGDAAPLLLPFLQPGPLAVPLLAAAFFARGTGVTGCNVHVNAIRQTIVPGQVLGRTNAAYRLLVYGVMPIGALLGGWLGATLGLQTSCSWPSVSGLRRSAQCAPARRRRSLRVSPALRALLCQAVGVYARSRL